MPPPGRTPFNGRTGCVERTFGAILLFLYLDLNRAADASEFNHHHDGKSARHCPKGTPAYG